MEDPDFKKCRERKGQKESQNIFMYFLSKVEGLFRNRLKVGQIEMKRNVVQL